MKRTKKYGKALWVDRRSPAYEKRMRIYRKRVPVFLAEHPRCAVFPNLPSTQNHHRFGRIGRLLLWEPGWCGVSQAGHDWIAAHKEEARKLGLLAPLGYWNDFDKAVRLLTPP